MQIFSVWWIYDIKQERDVLMGLISSKFMHKMLNNYVDHGSNPS